MILHRLRPGARDVVTGEFETMCGLRGLWDTSVRPFPPADDPQQRASDRFSSRGVDFYTTGFGRGLTCQACLGELFKNIKERSR